MPEEIICTIEFNGNALSQGEPQSVSISRDGVVLESVDRYGKHVAAERSLWVIERILRGKQAPLMVFCDGNYANRETLLSVVVDGRRYLGFWGEDLYGQDMNKRFGFEPASIDEETVLGEFYPVDELELCGTLIGWVEESVEEWDRELTHPPEDRLSSLYRDANDMVTYYRQHGSLEGFELSRTKEEVEGYLLDYERFPRTERYLREHLDVVEELVVEWLDSDLPDDEVESRLMTLMSRPDDWIRIRVAETLEQYPDERAWVAYYGFYSDDPEVKRATARLFAKIAHNCNARDFLAEAAEDSDDERTREIAREALAEYNS